MTPFEPAVIPESEIVAARNASEAYLLAFPDVARVALVGREPTPDAIFRYCDRIARQEASGEVFLNDTYQVHRRRLPGAAGLPAIVHLSIRRLDRMPVRDWRDFQEIKNQLVGPECEGVELFPAESRLVDSANQYHLWVIDDVHFHWPVGFEDGRSVSDAEFGKSRQRPRT